MTSYKCPKCGAELEDFYTPDYFISSSEWDDDRFRCNGHLIEPIPFPQVSKFSAVNRTKSCGYFGLEDLGVEYSDD
ncbi:TPA: hypothetical protein ACPP68_001624 [Haemophilus influenzae]